MKGPCVAAAAAAGGVSRGAAAGSRGLQGSASRKLLLFSLCYSVSAQDCFPGTTGTAMEDMMRLQHLSARVLLPLLLSLAMVATQTSSPVPAPLTRPCSFYTGKSCEECLKNVSCLWCLTNSTCLEYPVRSILPPSSLCAMSAARWGACWINFEALIIAMGVVAGILVLSIIVCCCYCCYCRKSSSSRLRLEAEEENLIREREKRKQESLQRKNERTVKHNEIRKKYGLLQDMDHPYSKFDNE